MMVLLRVVLVDLLAGLAGLLDDKEVVFALDDSLDTRVFMSGEDDEVVALLDDRLVAGGRKLDRLETGSATALAVERQGGGYAMLLSAVLDPLIHVAEDFFVARRSFSEVHAGMILCFRRFVQALA